MPEHDKLEVWCAGEKWCPITSTASLIGKKWHPVIIHRLLEEEPLGFNALEEEIDGISSKVLSESLEDLQNNKLVERKVVNEKPVRVNYALTDKGREMEPIMVEMAKWGKTNLSEPEK